MTTSRPTVSRSGRLPVVGARDVRVADVGRFSTDDVPFRERLDLLQAYSNDGHTPSSIRFPAGLLPSGRFTTIGNLRFGKAHILSAPHQLIRSSADIRRGSQDLVAVILVNRGTAVVEQNGQTVPAFADDMLLVYLDVPHRINLEGAHSVDTVRLPAEELPPGLRAQSPVLVNPRLTPTAAIAAGHLRWQPRDVHEMADAGEMIRSQLLALLAFAVDKAQQGDAPRDSLLEAVETIVEREIANPDLSAKLLCTRLGISRTTLFKALASGGTTLDILVRQRRLLGCLQDMRRSSGTANLTAISERWGYRDQSTFSRAFRRQHGRSPQRWLNENEA